MLCRRFRRIRRQELAICECAESIGCSVVVLFARKMSPGSWATANRF